MCLMGKCPSCGWAYSSRCPVCKERSRLQATVSVAELLDLIVKAIKKADGYVDARMSGWSGDREILEAVKSALKGDLSALKKLAGE